MTTGLGQNCVTRGRGPLEIPSASPQIGAKTETWLENSWRRSDNIVGDLEENYDITIHDNLLPGRLWLVRPMQWVLWRRPVQAQQ